MARYSNDTVEIHTTAESSAIAIGEITAYSDTLGSEVSTPDTALPYDKFQSVLMQRPEITFSTEALKTIIDNVGLTGKCILSDGTHPGFRSYQRQHDPCGAQGRKAGSNHRRVTLSGGHILVNSIQCSAGGNATISCTASAISSDGTTQPFVVAYNAGLPASPTQNQQYALGQVYAGGVLISQVTGVTVSYGPVAEAVMYGNSLWPTLFDVQKVRAVVTITTEDISILNDTGKIPLLGKASAHNDSYVRFIRREANAGYYSLSATEHIQGTFAGFTYLSRTSQASGGGVGSAEITVVCVDDGTNVPIVWDTAAAID